MKNNNFVKSLGERVGNLTFIGKDQSIIEPVRTEIALLIRASYCNPPSHGAYIVGKILNDSALNQEWS